MCVLGASQGHSMAHIQQEIKTNYKDIILVNWSVRYIDSSYITYLHIFVLGLSTYYNAH